MMSIFPIPMYDSESTSMPLEVPRNLLIIDCIRDAIDCLNQSFSAGYNNNITYDCCERDDCNTQHHILKVSKKEFFKQFYCNTLSKEDDSQTKQAELQRYESIIKRKHFSNMLEEPQDWDKSLPKPKVHRAGKITVRLHFTGRGKPLPFTK